jgi:2-amino-4-hydroxy-6-hydroxymethyldihydropteridine diphosphokinase
MLVATTRPKKPTAETYVALGSNIEPRSKYIERALNLMNHHPQISVDKVSTIYETEPVGGPESEQDMLYLNAVAKIATTLSSIALLDALQSIEEELGRKRDTFWGARTIDLDILLFGSEIISTDRLIVPHPLMHERRFVMQPLVEIAPTIQHPVLGMSAQTILESLGDRDLENSQ